MHAGMRRASLFTAVAITLAVALGGTAFAQAVGTWKLNLAKSKYQQGQAPKSTTLVYEAAGAGIKVTVDQVPADGPAIHYTVTSNYDGKRCSCRRQPERRYGCSHASGCHHDEVGQQKGWENPVHRDPCRLRRWEDADYHYDRQGCQGADHR